MIIHECIDDTNECLGVYQLVQKQVVERNGSDLNPV